MSQHLQPTPLEGVSEPSLITHRKHNAMLSTLMVIRDSGLQGDLGEKRNVLCLKSQCGSLLKVGLEVLRDSK